MEDAQRETGETGETGDTWEQTWYLSKLLHKLAHLENSYLKKTSIWSQIISRNSSNSTDPLPSVSATLDGHQMVIVVIKIVKWLWLCQRWSNIAMDRYDNLLQHLLSRLLVHCICLCLLYLSFCKSHPDHLLQHLLSRLVTHCLQHWSKLLLRKNVKITIWFTLTKIWNRLPSPRLCHLHLDQKAQKPLASPEALPRKT